jgi:acyl-CoA thioester hydrolase
MTIDLSIEIELTPAFHDLDPMEIVWHGHYVKYLELARTALLRHFGYDYPQMRASGYAWPIVDLQLKYIASAVYDQRLRVRAEIVEWENRLRIAYLISDAATGQRLTKAQTTQLAVKLQTGQMQYVCPPILWQCLGVEQPS